MYAKTGEDGIINFLLERLLLLKLKHYSDFASGAGH
jgi:hypothetical protein